MSLTLEQQRQVEALINKALASFPRQKDVEDVTEALIEKHKDKTKYAPEKHKHDASDVRGLEAIREGLAPEDHSHACEDITGLDEKIAQAVATVEVPTDYAKADHAHSFEEITGTIPVSRIQGGDKILLALKTLEDLKNHDHEDIREAIKALKKYVDALPKPAEYDDSELRTLISGLKDLIQKTKPVSPVVDVKIEPVSVSKVTCEAEYLIVSSGEEPTVTDAKGKKGSVKVTPSGDKYVVRAVYPEKPVQPLTFTFPSPPTLCSIGISTGMES